ncbi:MAG: 50S ribosomal protein L21 [Candidatus Muirbacterium halophilum]|nr:50S ribosomal protein L21 [Candidatus Muirbacterium halophilum]
MYAIVENGGKQYKVTPDLLFKVERMDVEENSTIELSNVLLLNDGKDSKIGNPFVSGAKVVCSVLEHGKAKKVVVFKYKPKKKYRKLTGHRQQFTTLKVDKIQG